MNFADIISGIIKVCEDYTIEQKNGSLYEEALQRLKNLGKMLSERLSSTSDVNAVNQDLQEFLRTVISFISTQDGNQSLSPIFESLGNNLAQALKEAGHPEQEEYLLKPAIPRNKNWFTSVIAIFFACSLGDLSEKPRKEKKLEKINKVSATLNGKLSISLNDAKGTLEKSFGYKWRKFFSSVMHYDELSRSLVKISKEISTLSTAENYLEELKLLEENFNRFSNEKMLGDLPALKALAKVQDEVYNHLYNNFPLTTEQRRQATSIGNRDFFRKNSMALDDIHEKLKGNFIKRKFNEIFSRQTDRQRGRLIDGIKAKLNELVSSNNPESFRADFIVYLESLRAAIVELSEFEKGKQRGSHKKLKNELQKLLQDAVTKIVLNKDVAGQANYQAEFGIELDACIYPICNLALGSDNECTKEVGNYVHQKRNDSDKEILTNFVDVYEEEVKNNKANNFIKTLSASAVGQIEREFKSKEMTANLKQFQESVYRSFVSFSFTALISNDVVTQKNSRKEKDAGTISSIAGLVTSIPTVGETLSKILDKVAGVVSDKGAEERGGMYKASAAKLNHVEDIQQVATYVSIKLTQMLEFQINRVDSNEVNELAKLLVQRMLMALADPKLKSQFKNVSLAQLGRALCEAVFQIDLKQGALNLLEYSLLLESDDSEIYSPDGWTLEGVLQSGIVVEENGIKHYYAGTSSKPGKYGFIRGTKELVDKLSYDEMSEATVIKARENAKQNDYVLSFDNLPDMGDGSTLDKEREKRLQREVDSSKTEITALRVEIDELKTVVSKVEDQLRTSQMTCVQLSEQNQLLREQNRLLMMALQQQQSPPQLHISSEKSEVGHHNSVLSDSITHFFDTTTKSQKIEENCVVPLPKTSLSAQG